LSTGIRCLRMCCGYWIFPQNEHARLHWKKRLELDEQRILVGPLDLLLEQVVGDPRALPERDGHQLMASLAPCSESRPEHASTQSTKAEDARRSVHRPRTPAMSVRGLASRRSTRVDHHSKDGDGDGWLRLRRSTRTPCRRRSPPCRGGRAARRGRGSWKRCRRFPTSSSGPSAGAARRGARCPGRGGSCRRSDRSSVASTTSPARSEGSTAPHRPATPMASASPKSSWCRPIPERATLMPGRPERTASASIRSGARTTSFIARSAPGRSRERRAGTGGS
jgi:hypothetical protein